MTIFILEDHLIQREHLKKFIDKVQQKYGKDIPVISTNRPDEIISNASQSAQINLYFLDIEIKKDKLSGLKTAQRIREIDAEGVIVFITTHAELAPVSYKYMVSALTFIEKNNWDEMSQAIKECLAYYHQRLGGDNHQAVFTFSNQHTSFRIPYAEILYIQTSENHRLILVSTKQVIQFYASLKSVEDALEDAPQFVRGHQSHIVNVDHVREISKKESTFTLFNGQELPLSRRMYKNVMRLWKKGRNG